MSKMHFALNFIDRIGAFKLKNPDHILLLSLTWRLH